MGWKTFSTLVSCTHQMEEVLHLYPAHSYIILSTEKHLPLVVLKKPFVSKHELLYDAGMLKIVTDVL